MENYRIGTVNREKLSSKVLSLAAAYQCKITGGSKKGKSSRKLLEEPRKQYKKKMRPLTQYQIDVFRQAFEIFDTDHSGYIDKTELGSLLHAMGFDYTPTEIAQVFNSIDKDGSGMIEVDYFIDFMSKQILDTDNIRKQITKVFKHFDDDNTGYLDVRKIKLMLAYCFFNLDDESVTNLISSADTEGDGLISEYEFMRIMKKVKLI